MGAVAALHLWIAWLTLAMTTLVRSNRIMLWRLTPLRLMEFPNQCRREDAMAMMRGRKEIAVKKYVADSMT